MYKYLIIFFLGKKRRRGGEERGGEGKGEIDVCLKSNNIIFISKNLFT